jgi:4'-phosphopantetheinyl transferase
LNIEPRDVQFAVNASGKPEIAPRLQSQYGCLHFNQAHSGHLGIFAFCRNRRIGIDLEEIRPFPDIDQIADLLLSPHELEAFRELPQEERCPVFFRAWTHKEAFVKAIGQGLTLPLNHFEISRTGPHTSQIVQNHAHPPRPLDWFVKDLSAPAQFSAAVCVEGTGWKIRCCKR